MDSYHLFVVERMCLCAGLPQWHAAVRRECDGFGGPNNQGPDHLVIFSLPLNDEIFLDVGFNVMAWTPDRAKDKKWKPKAEAWRELILATVVLERKTSAPR
ncbi:MAG: hypothetical protein KBC32_03800 [Candidatus Didemnitutus sp.]|nr:hypothetical protein [Candidatus Didemnitutus sp.]